MSLGLLEEQIPFMVLTADEAREVRIEALRRALITAKDPLRCTLAWELMCEEIRARSPGQISRMEHARGL